MTAIHTYLSVGLDFDVSIPQKFLSAVEITTYINLHIVHRFFQPFRIPLIRYYR
ncbi:hypothetical protein T07_14639 [Trichinella nelsoni]|uniref:Uncharacterized protein n=1 Tax=Trichinella nelsoni TaxID=6336 RepID=A0A0V0RAW4_9BILA|nr:hypothetical protein T07_14639 [Trichinella nelsoni]